MKTLVAIVAVPDTTSKIGFINNNKEVDYKGIQFIINPYDEWCALVRAIELKEKFGGTVTVITVGSVDTEPLLRRTLAIGADDAIRIDLNPKDAHTVAIAIANAIKDENFDLILLGKESIQDNGGQIAGMLSELLNMPCITEATHLEIQEDKKKATCSVDSSGYLLTLEASLPLIVSASEGMAKQRIPNMKGIMSAKSKPIVVHQFDAPNTSYTDIISYELPPKHMGCTLFKEDEMDQLVEALKLKK